MLHFAHALGAVSSILRCSALLMPALPGGPVRTHMQRDAVFPCLPTCQLVILCRCEHCKHARVANTAQLAQVYKSQDGDMVADTASGEDDVRPTRTGATHSGAPLACP